MGDSISIKAPTLEQTLHHAVAQHQAGRLQEAGELYLAILRNQPNHPEANYNMGTLAVQMKQPAAALPYFTNALEVDPTRRQFWLSYIDALIQADLHDGARQILALAQQQGLEGDEVDALAARLRGSAPVTATPAAENRPIRQESQPAAPSNTQNCSPHESNTLAALFNQGHYQEAETLAHEFTVRFPQHGFGWMVLGAVFKQLGRISEALIAMQKAVALSPDDANSHTNLGSVFQDLGRMAEAEASLRRALQIDPNNAQALINLGVTLQAQGRMVESETSLRRALIVNPNQAQAHNNLGNTLLGQGRKDEAETSYRQALRINPDFAEAHHNLASVLKDRGRLDAAHASCQRALRINPVNTATRRLLNEIIRQLGWLPDYLAPTVFDHANDRLLHRYFPLESDSFIYVIEVAGTCNLRCPTCPVGNFSDAVRPKGFMEMDVFRSIVEKIKRECVAPNPKVWLFNWGEPLLHPQLPAMISLLKQNGLYVLLSTNLNIKKNLEEVIRSDPDEIKISLSAFTQEFYSKTHTKGNVELVKENMILIRNLIEKFNVATKVYVGHHLYRHNTHESAAVEKLCEILKFDYRPLPAFYQPLEKMISLIEGKSNASETELLANLLVHPLETLVTKQKSIDGNLDCELRFNMTSINYDGSVALCCSVYDYQNMLGVNFVDTAHADIQALKYKNPLCKTCYGHGLQYSKPLPIQTH
jgi:tetratricopeptide (TPR) repeat protein/organic radical activating enzyme